MFTITITILLMMICLMPGIIVSGNEYEAPVLTKFIREVDAIKQWGISKATFIRARKKGLKFYRHGAFICYKPEELEAHFCQPRSWKAITPESKGERNEG